MAATTRIAVKMVVDGLVDSDIDISASEVGPDTPTLAGKPMDVIATANTAQVLALNGITTVHYITFLALDGDISIDTSYSASFNEEIIAYEGVPTVFTPAGTVYVKNKTTDETPTFQYGISGE